LARETILLSFKYFKVDEEAILRKKLATLSICDEVGQEVGTLDFHSYDEFEDWTQTIEGLNFGLVNMLRRDIV
jgi:hypothetical protein